jgi:beta-glucanase (GH16 family)
MGTSMGRGKAEHRLPADALERRARLKLRVGLYRWAGDKLAGMRFPGPHSVARLALLILAAELIHPITSSSRVCPTGQPLDPSGWTLAWSDEFNGAAHTGVNTANWLYDTGAGYGCPGCPSNWGTHEVESMSSSTANVYQDGAGHLLIKPIHVGSSATAGWTSGRIETQRTDFQPPAGGAMAVEASIQQPDVTGDAAAGYWPAFWMLGAPFRGNYLNWPSVGEIDIMEDINGLSYEFGTLHCGTSPDGPCNEYTGLSSGPIPCPSCQTAFHTYRVEFDRSISPEQIRWYLDGVNFFTVCSDRLDSPTWATATNHGFFIILDVAMGGDFPAAFGGGPTTSTVSGIPMLVDYVRVFGRPFLASTNTPTASATTTGSAAPTATETPFPQFVDVNCDAAVSAADLPALVLLLRSGKAGACGGDVNGDGSVDEADLTAMIAGIFRRPRFA